MVTKADIVTTFNELFESNKEYKDLSIHEKIYALLVLTSGSSGGTTDTVTIRDKTNSANKLAIDSNGLIGINNLTTLATKLDNLLTELDKKADLTETQPVSQNSNPVLTTITFNSSTTSNTFTITNRLAIIVIPILTGAPTLTLQVTLDSGTTWVDTSVTVSSSASTATIIEADSLAKVSGAFGLSNAFRFNSDSSIISATLTLRSIIQ